MAVNRRQAGGSAAAALAVGLGAMKVDADTASTAPDPPPFRRGINIHHLLNWPETRFTRSRFSYLWPPYASARYQMSDAEITALSHAGFDFVRVTVAPDIFLKVDAAKRAVLHALLRRTVERFLAAGLGVIVDLHPIDSPAKLGPRAIVADPGGPLFAAYVALAGDVAATLAPLADQRVALELFNEPPILDTPGPAQWQAMAQCLCRAARSQAPGLWLVVSGGRDGDPSGLLALDPAPFDPQRVLFSFHYYEPLAFTHQTANQFRRIAGLPWPVGAGDALAALARASLDIAGHDGADGADAALDLANTGAALADCVARNHGPASIAAHLRAVADWGKRRGVARSHILLGEFGVVKRAAGFRGADDASRARWLRAVRLTAESEGFGWCFWDYKRDGFALADGAGARLDRVALNALGLG
jgi:endoglucanase